MDDSYFGGFFDGEGSVAVSSWRFGKSYTLRCHVTNTDFTIIKKLHKKYGGNISVEDTQNKNHRDKLTLTWYSDECKRILKIIYPYSVIKKDQIQLALTFPINKTNKPRSKKLIDKQKFIYEELKFMKHKRHIIPDVYKNSKKKKHNMRKTREKLAKDLYAKDNTLTCREIGSKIGVSATMVSKYIKIKRKQTYKKP